MTFLQVTAVVTSFFLWCLFFVMWRQNVEKIAQNKNWTLKDTTLDMVWNILSISPRVIALALFASYKPYWFCGLILTQIIIVTIGFTWFHYHDEDPGGDVDDVVEITNVLISNFISGIGSVFTMCTFITLSFPIYLLYWFLTFIENVVVILLWYHWSSDMGLWYHHIAPLYVIVSYSVSLIIKILHCYFYKSNRREKRV